MCPVCHNARRIDVRISAYWKGTTWIKAIAVRDCFACVPRKLAEGEGVEPLTG